MAMNVELRNCRCGDRLVYRGYDVYKNIIMDSVVGEAFVALTEDSNIHDTIIAENTTFQLQCCVVGSLLPYTL